MRDIHSKKNYTSKKWTTKYGEEISIRTMDVSHIQNCINQILRCRYTPTVPNWREEYLLIFEEELARRKSKKLNSYEIY